MSKKVNTSLFRHLPKDEQEDAKKTLQNAGAAIDIVREALEDKLAAKGTFTEEDLKTAS